MHDSNEAPWQLFPDLTVDEFEALKADIAERGVMVPVEYDEAGAILDGHHRVRACRELGIKDWPTVTRGGMDDEAKAEHVLSLNLSRRHLSREQRRELVARLRTDRGWSLRRISDRLGVSKSQVERDASAAVVPNGTPARVEGSDGKSYAATKPTPPPSIFTPTSRQQPRAATALRDLGDDAPAKTLDVKRAERIARERAAHRLRQQPTDPSTSHGDVEIRHGSLTDVLGDLAGTVDAIITDPPYERDAYYKDSLYEKLGEVAATLLKPNGILAVMIGSRLEALDQSDSAIARHMRRRHRGVYLTPGQRWRDQVERVAVGYKPILIYAHPASTDLRWINDDVFTSSDAHKQDARFHHWGQTEAGFAALVERLSEPGALVVDPFLGGGTTAVVCRDLGRRFVGCDIDAAAIATARERLDS